ncbi:MAG: Verru_Chthon cassette protein B [Chthoniobacteraceae bacterium]
MSIPQCLTLRTAFAGKKRSGFSLIEVVMALGIVSFAFVAIFGLLPIGLTSFRNAMDASIGSQIVQQVVTDVQQEDFSQFGKPALAGQVKFPIRYFNDQGIQVGDQNNPPTASGMLQVVYWEKTVVQTPSPAISGTSSNMASSNLATIIVDVVKNPGNKALQTDPSTGGILEQPSNGIYVSRYFAFASQAP